MLILELFDKHSHLISPYIPKKMHIRIKGNSKFAKFVLNVSEWCVCAVMDY